MRQGVPRAVAAATCRGTTSAARLAHTHRLTHPATVAGMGLNRNRQHASIYNGIRYTSQRSSHTHSGLAATSPAFVGSGLVRPTTTTTPASAGQSFQQKKKKTRPYRQQFHSAGNWPGKVLVANRGEVACRIIRTCKRLGIPTVAVYAETDQNAKFVRMADESIPLTNSAFDKPYLDIDQIVAVAQRTGCWAVHPGYGFLSENSVFAKRLRDIGCEFIGPDSDAITYMGDKASSKLWAERAGVRNVPGSGRALESEVDGHTMADKIGYPVMVKAAAGGGGKGMRIAWSPSELNNIIRLCRTEAESSFGDGRLLIEKYIQNPRHIEIQVIGDKHGNIYYLPERDCSIQRRNQKVLEEAPAPGVSPELRRRMGEQAVALSKAVGYYSAGTCEFLLDGQTNEFYFLEMNTRLQVEHPVTEYVTGLDLVEIMIRVANGEELVFDQEKLAVPHGYALEARLYAEDPYDCIPLAGKLTRYEEPYQARYPNYYHDFGDDQRSNVVNHDDYNMGSLYNEISKDTGALDGGPEELSELRIDSGVIEGDDIPIQYDPLIAKVVSYNNKARTHAIRELLGGLGQYTIQGIQTNIPLLMSVLSDPEYQEGKTLSTHFLERKAFIPRDKEKMIQSHGEQDNEQNIAAHLHKRGKLSLNRKILGYKFEDGAFLDVGGPIAIMAVDKTEQTQHHGNDVRRVKFNDIELYSYPRASDEEVVKHITGRVFVETVGEMPLIELPTNDRDEYIRKSLQLDELLISPNQYHALQETRSHIWTSSLILHVLNSIRPTGPHDTYTSSIRDILTRAVYAVARAGSAIETSLENINSKGAGVSNSTMNDIFGSHPHQIRPDSSAYKYQNEQAEAFCENILAELGILDRQFFISFLPYSVRSTSQLTKSKVQYPADESSVDNSSALGFDHLASSNNLENTKWIPFKQLIDESQDSDVISMLPHPDITHSSAKSTLLAFKPIQSSTFLNSEFSLDNVVPDPVSFVQARALDAVQTVFANQNAPSGEKDWDAKDGSRASIPTTSNVRYNSPTTPMGKRHIKFRKIRISADDDSISSNYIIECVIEVRDVKDSLESKLRKLYKLDNGDMKTGSYLLKTRSRYDPIRNVISTIAEKLGHKRSELRTKDPIHVQVKKGLPSSLPWFGIDVVERGIPYSFQIFDNFEGLAESDSGGIGEFIQGLYNTGFGSALGSFLPSGVNSNGLPPVDSTQSSYLAPIDLSLETRVRLDACRKTLADQEVLATCIVEQYLSLLFKQISDELVLNTNFDIKESVETVNSILNKMVQNLDDKFKFESGETKLASEDVKKPQLHILRAPMQSTVANVSVKSGETVVLGCSSEDVSSQKKLNEAKGNDDDSNLIKIEEFALEAVTLEAMKLQTAIKIDGTSRILAAKRSQKYNTANNNSQQTEQIVSTDTAQSSELLKKQRISSIIEGIIEEEIPEDAVNTLSKDINKVLEETFHSKLKTIDDNATLSTSVFDRAYKMTQRIAPALVDIGPSWERIRLRRKEKSSLAGTNEDESFDKLYSALVYWASVEFLKVFNSHVKDSNQAIGKSHGRNKSSSSTPTKLPKNQSLSEGVLHKIQHYSQSPKPLLELSKGEPYSVGSDHELDNILSILEGVCASVIIRSKLLPETKSSKLDVPQLALTTMVLDSFCGHLPDSAISSSQYSIDRKAAIQTAASSAVVSKVVGSTSPHNDVDSEGMDMTNGSNEKSDDYSIERLFTEHRVSPIDFDGSCANIKYAGTSNSLFQSDVEHDGAPMDLETPTVKKEVSHFGTLVSRAITTATNDMVTNIASKRDIPTINSKVKNEGTVKAATESKEPAIKIVNVFVSKGGVVAKGQPLINYIWV